MLFLKNSNENGNYFHLVIILSGSLYGAVQLFTSPLVVNISFPCKNSFFLAFDFCRFCMVIRFFHPRHNGQWPPTSKDFLSQILSIENSWERASIFPFKCSVRNKGTTGTIFITSLVWRGPWLGIEPGTSCSRSQHYTTRLLRRR